MARDYRFQPVTPLIIRPNQRIALSSFNSVVGPNYVCCGGLKLIALHNIFYVYHLECKYSLSVNIISGVLDLVYLLSSYLDYCRLSII